MYLLLIWVCYDWNTPQEIKSSPTKILGSLGGLPRIFIWIKNEIWINDTE
jgi:hypothetical protein